MAMGTGTEGEKGESLKEDRGYKYKISVRTDGQYDFAVWSTDANIHRDVPIWRHTVATEAQAERLVKQWIDEQRSRPDR
jgi:hypothetical protein